MTTLNDRVSGIQTARQLAAQDSCRLIIGLVDVATPASRRRAAAAYIAQTPLRNCASYGRSIR